MFASLWIEQLLNGGVRFQVEKTMSYKGLLLKERICVSKRLLLKERIWVIFFPLRVAPMRIEYKTDIWALDYSPEYLS